MSSSEGEIVAWFLKRKPELVSLVSRCSNLLEHPFLLAADSLINIPENELHLKVFEIKLVIHYVKESKKQRDPEFKQQQESELFERNNNSETRLIIAESLLSLKESDASADFWQQKNGGHVILRATMIKAFEMAVRKKMGSAWVFGEEHLKEVAKHFENYHFFQSSSLNDYFSFEIAQKHILQKVREMKVEMRECMN